MQISLRNLHKLDCARKTGFHFSSFRSGRAQETADYTAQAARRKHAAARAGSIRRGHFSNSLIS
jgi:hypothetical protein